MKNQRGQLFPNRWPQGYPKENEQYLYATSRANLKIKRILRGHFAEAFNMSNLKTKKKKEKKKRQQKKQQQQTNRKKNKKKTTTTKQTNKKTTLHTISHL